MGYTLDLPKRLNQAYIEWEIYIATTFSKGDFVKRFPLDRYAGNQIVQFAFSVVIIKKLRDLLMSELYFITFSE